MAEQIYNSEYGQVEYIKEDNVVLLTWKQFCCYANYRNTALAALEALRANKNSNFVVDARNGFEDEKDDAEWGVNILLPAMSETTCKAVIFIMNVVNDIEEEMDMWTKEFKKYFAVYKVDSYNIAIKALSPML